MFLVVIRLTIGFEFGFAHAVGSLGLFEDGDEMLARADDFAGFVEDGDGLADHRGGWFWAAGSEA
jgi:hypothetical protein